MPISAGLKPFFALLRAIALLLALFLAVYIPAFVAAGGFRLPQQVAVPVIILVTLAVACSIIGVFAHRPGALPGQFGFRWPSWRYVFYSLAAAAPLSVLVAWALGRFSEPGPLAGLSLGPWLVLLYFVVGAPVQEEVIFRGLLQTVLARRLGMEPTLDATSGTLALLLSAMLFAAIHLVVGPATAAGALVLGVLAGLLKERSGSLLPAIICHSVFNLAGILWVHS